MHTEQRGIEGTDHRLGRLLFYHEYLAERDEVLRHKWFESERAGRDVGYTQALASWVIHHRAAWLRARRAHR